jgi:dCMP deaminase
MNSWDEYFIRMAMFVAQKSKDDSTKVGCVIVSPDNTVLSMGYNGFPRGVCETLATTCKQCMGTGRRDMIGNLSAGRDQPWNPCFICDGTGKILTNEIDPERWHKRPEKYQWVEHAERNAIYNAAREGITLKGSTAYLNWEPVPCSDCTRALIQAGVVEVVGPDIPFGGAGAGKHYHVDEISKTMLKEARVQVRIVKVEDE